MMRIILMVAAAFAMLGLPSPAQATQTYDLSAWECDLLKSSPPKLSVGEAVRRATRKVMPGIPGDATIRDARVTVVIAVDATGSVQCVHAKQGHPLLIASCIEAAKDWKFKPYTAKGHRSAFLVDLTFHFTNQKVVVD
jgi:outer membrane biosynthesis protein TonB